jgi:hypothetical protein
MRRVIVVIRFASHNHSHHYFDDDYESSCTHTEAVPNQPCHMPRPRARPPRVGPPRAPPRPERNDGMSQRGPIEKTSEAERKAHLVVALHCDLQRRMPDEHIKGAKNGETLHAPRPAPPECVPPRELLPASRARVCSSLTTSSSASGTRKYFIYSQNN